MAYADLGKFDDAWRCIGEAMTAVETTNERWHAAEINRVAGEIALKSPEPDATKAEIFPACTRSRAAATSKILGIARAMSMARLWRDQGKAASPRTARSSYGWFTEGFDTLDPKEAKVLLDELA